MPVIDQPDPRRRSLMARIFLSPDERRLRAGWRMLTQFLLLIICLELFGLLSRGIFPTLSGNTAMLLSLLISLLAITLSIYLARRGLDRRSFVSLGLYLNRWVLRDVLAGIAISGIIIGLVYLAERASGWLTFNSFSWKTQSISQVLLQTVGVLLVFVFVAWQEELLSRGYWLQNIEQGLNLLWAVLLSSLLFALLHLDNPNVSWVAILGLLAGGIFLAFGYVRTRLLWLPIGLHIGWNFFEGAVFGFPVSGLTFIPRLINQQVQGPVLITGGAFGPEAGLIIIPAILVGAVLVYYYTRGRKTEQIG